MKKNIHILIAVFFSVLFSCNVFGKREDSGIQIQHDTLTVNIKGRIGQIIKFRNKYYCFVERDNPYSSNSFRDFYILSSNGTVDYKTQISENINTGDYNDLFVKNDSILLKDYYDHITFNFDTINYEWKEINEVEDLIYEDEDYSVYYLDFGEWGNTVWFKNKKTKKEYELASSFPKIHKINNVYYLTNSRSILKIENPTRLKLCDTSYYYEAVEKLKWSQGSSSMVGTKTLFQDTSSWYNSKFYIATSFIIHDSLFCIYTDGNSTYLGYIDSSKIQSIKNIGMNLNIYRRHNSYRGDQNKYKNQLLKFQSYDRRKEKLIEIDKNVIRIIDIKNTDTVKLLGEIRADKTFKFLTEYHIKNIDNLFLSQIDSIVPNYGGYNVTPEHKISIGTDLYPNKHKFELETPRAYKIIEDSTITLLLNYYYSKENNSVKVICYEWKETWENDYNIYAPENEEFKINKFQNRLNNLKNYLKNRFGMPLGNKQRSNNSDMEWITDRGINIRLFWNDLDKYGSIVMYIYKE